MKKIGIVILNYNGLRHTAECLESLQKIIQQGFEATIYVVDYSIDKHEGQSIQSKFPAIHLIQKDSNLGFAGGNNVGITRALNDGVDYVLLLNNDTVVSPDFLRELYSYLEENPDVGAVSPKIYFAKGYEFHKDRYDPSDLGKVVWYAGAKIDWENMYSSHIGVDEVDNGQFQAVMDPEHISGCCVLIRKETLEKVGLLDEKLFLYWEDTDWSIRCKHMGWKIVMYPSSVIWHKNAGSSGSGSNLQDYFMSRNRLWIGMKYAPLRTKLALFRQSLIQLMRGRKWERIGVRDFWFGKMGNGSWITN